MILFVCEGNVCRSPAAAALLARYLVGTGLPWQIESAGTRALLGSPADDMTLALAGQYEIDLTAHRGRQLDRQLASSATLMLAASRRVRGEMVAHHPPAVRYAFTIRQLARILNASDAVRPEGGPEQRIARLRDHAVRHRGLLAVGDPDDDDVVDPFRHPAKVHTEMFSQLVPALRVIGGALGATTAT